MPRYRTSEDQFVERLRGTPGCPFTAAQFRPDLDVVDREMAEPAFVR